MHQKMMVKIGQGSVERDKQTIAHYVTKLDTIKGLVQRSLHRGQLVQVRVLQEVVSVQLVQEKVLLEVVRVQ